MSSDYLLYQTEGFLFVLAAAAWVLWWLLGRLRRRRPDLRITGSIASAMVIRIVAAGAVSLLPNSRGLRGIDELTFLANAQQIRASPLLSILLGHSISPLHQWLFAVQQRLFDASDLTLRLTQITLSVIGLTLVATAVYDLAGARAARLAAWLLALEPTGVFYSSFLHKEPLITLAMGLVAYGGASMWGRRSMGAVAVMGAGCTVATLARPYAGWFLIGASIAITLHATLRHQRGRRAALSAAAIVGVVLAVIPIGLQAAPAQLQRLKDSQDANTADATANLRYSKVDYSSPAAIARNLPGRVGDFLLRPYPWELKNTNQQLGAIGGLVGVVTLTLFAFSVLWHRRRTMSRAGPLIYVTAFLVVAYAAIAGNAGTAFRLRENVTAMLICAVCALYRRREHTSPEAEKAASAAYLQQPSAGSSPGATARAALEGHPIWLAR
ncbi:MAG: glycosyltransferase family 39 protein [Solirubrobacteraceae bacterium]